MKKNIFISYAQADYALAHKLTSGIDSFNVHGWMDNADIAAGTASMPAVRSAIKNSSAFVVLVTPNSRHNIFS